VAGFATGLWIVEELRPPGGDQLYVSPPVAFKLTATPAHVVCGPLMVGLGTTLTVTTTDVSFVHVPLLTCSEYVVVVAGETVIEEDVEVVPPLHTYELPPEAVSVVLPPVHIELAPVIPALIAGLTVTVTLALSLHVPLLTKTEYVVVVAGLTLMEAFVEALLQVYALPPEAVKTVEFPGQTVSLPVIDAVKEAPTVTITLAVSVHPAALVPIIVYVSVDTGLAVTLLPEVLLNPVAGDQEYVFAPEATRFTLPPEHIPGEGGVTVTEGLAFTFTATV
jgi:hypothetical protein